MVLLTILAMMIALVSLAVSALAIALSLKQPTPATLPPVEANPTLPSPSPLEGLKVALAIRQDHAHPVFTDLLAEALRQVDAEVVSGEGEIAISGSVACNGYSDVYYRAELTCATPSETLCTIIENPAAGDRQANLAGELIAKLEQEITKRLSRNERRLALRELKDP